MKKLMTMLICTVLSIGTAVAQNSKTYNGFVVDNNGNPIVGAEVMAPGGGASAITDSDGSFTIEVPFLLKKLTASYTGMQDKSIKLGESSNLVFKMRSLKKMTGFISVIGNFGYFNDSYTYSDSYSGSSWDEDYSQVALGGGIMGGQIGQLGKWGWYVKGMGYLGLEYSDGTGSLTAGAIRRLGTKAHLYFGGGAAYIYDIMGFSLDLGTIFTVSDHVNVIAGLNYANASSSYDKYNQINLNIGVGYTF